MHHACGWAAQVDAKRDRCCVLGSRCTGVIMLCGIVCLMLLGVPINVLGARLEWILRVSVLLIAFFLIGRTVGLLLLMLQFPTRRNYKFLSMRGRACQRRSMRLSSKRKKKIAGILICVLAMASTFYLWLSALMEVFWVLRKLSSASWPSEWEKQQAFQSLWRLHNCGRGCRCVFGGRMQSWLSASILP